MGTVRVSEPSYRKLEQLHEELPGSPPLSRLADEAIERYDPFDNPRPDNGQR